MIEVIKNLIVDYGQTVANRAVFATQELIIRQLQAYLESIRSEQANGKAKAELLFQGTMLVDKEVESFTHCYSQLGVSGQEITLRLQPQLIVNKGLTITSWGADITQVLVGNKLQEPGLSPFVGRMTKTTDRIDPSIQLTITLKFH